MSKLGHCGRRLSAAFLAHCETAARLHRVDAAHDEKRRGAWASGLAGSGELDAGGVVRDPGSGRSAGPEPRADRFCCHTAWRDPGDDAG